MDYGAIVRAVLFALFAALTAAITAVIGPTYDGLLVPELAPASVYAAWSSGGVFATGVSFSNIVLVDLVDPAAVLVIAVVGGLYLIRAVMPSPRLARLAPRLVIGILVANFVLPITSALWQVAAAVYPVFYDLGGGAWQSYGNLVGAGGLTFSWDNGVVSFVVSLMLLSMVLMLVFLVAFRTALLAVLLVLLPPLTLLWAIPAAAPLARKAWTIFLEMTFLPGLLIVPLALAVGAPSILLTLGFFAVALAMPQLLSVAGHSASQMGLANPGSLVAGGMAEGTRNSSQMANGFARSGGGGLLDGYRLGKEAPTKKLGVGAAPATVPKVAGRAAGSLGSGSLGPVGGVVWGMSEGIGSLARQLGRRLGERSGAASAAQASPETGPDGRPAQLQRTPPMAAKGQRVSGLSEGVSSSRNSAARPARQGGA